MFIEDADHLVSKTYMTRVEGENTREAALPGSITPKDIVLLQVSWDVEVFLAVTAALFEV